MNEESAVGSSVTGPLDGIRVVDLTRVLAGPYCTQMLGDLGADVIKIERPGSGDDTRRFAPPYLKDHDGNATTESAYFLGANRNKRSVAVDITQSDGQQIVKELINTADIVVENFKTGNLKKYGLSYEVLKADNSGLVYCSITGFGQTGPYADRPGYDFLIQGMGGIMSLTGEVDGEPQKVGVLICDLMAGMFATVAIGGALFHAKTTGQGQHIDIGMLDAQVAWLANAAMNYLYAGDLGRLGNAHPNIVPYQPFATADGHIVLAIGNDAQFEKFCDISGQSAIGSNERFATNADRIANREELMKTLELVLRAKPSAHWLQLLEENKIGCGPINNLQEVFEDPHVLAREMVLEVMHSANGGTSAKLVASPIKFSETAVQYRNAPPLLGEHTTEVLEGVLGLNVDQINALQQSGAIEGQLR